MKSGISFFVYKYILTFFMMFGCHKHFPQYYNNVSLKYNSWNWPYILNSAQNIYEIYEYLLEPNDFMQRLLVQILFVFLLYVSISYLLLAFSANSFGLFAICWHLDDFKKTLSQISLIVKLQVEFHTLSLVVSVLSS